MESIGASGKVFGEAMRQERYHNGRILGTLTVNLRAFRG